jgi:hypothetical protein
VVPDKRSLEGVAAGLVILKKQFGDIGRLSAFAFSWYSRPMSSDDLSRLDRSSFSVVSLHDPSDEMHYWLSRTPEERLQAVELMRQIIYGYDPATTRLQRFFEVATRETS